MRAMVVDYTKPPPPEYRCARCEATGVKLWRWYNKVPPILICADCACQSTGYNSEDLDAEGMHTDEAGEQTNVIAGYVPAIPVAPDARGFWGHGACATPPKPTTNPQALVGFSWWKGLPTKLAAPLPIKQPEPEPPVKHYTLLKGRKINY